MDTNIFTQRRTKLLSLLDNKSMVLLPAYRELGRNYPANPYLSFRASSHFLYFVGQSFSHAYFLLIPNQKPRLYIEENTVSDQLWHGKTPTFQEIGVQNACEVYALNALANDLRQLGLDQIATVPSFYPHIQQEQSKLLGREISSPLHAQDQDALLCDAIVQMRMIHDEFAIAQLKDAAALTSKAHIFGMNQTKSAKNTAQLFADFMSVLQREGLTSSYPPIITTHGEVLHCHHYHDRLENGDLLLVDFGAENAHGWAGDVTRTWPVNGRFDDAQKLIYQMVLDIQKSAINLVKPNVEYRKIHEHVGFLFNQALLEIGILKGATAQTLYEYNCHALFFPHGIGHLIGLDVHDMEDLGDRAGYQKGRSRSTRFGDGYLRLDRPLQKGMAVTIEPGFYQVEALLNHPEIAGEHVAKHVDWDRLAQFKSVRGIRIEDDILVGEDGPINLTQSIPKEINDLEDLLRRS
jgi:Xaa-Pro aminopeptidase